MFYNVAQEVRVPEQLSLVRAVIRVPAQESAAGWKYQGRLLRVGEPFTFDMSLQVMRGLIVGIRVPGQDEAGRTSGVEAAQNP